MFDVGSTEFIVIILVFLIFIGPKRLPEVARKLGRIIGELKMASRDLRNQIDLDISDIEPPSKIARDIRRELIDAIPSPYEEMRKIENKVKQELSETMGPDEEMRKDEKTSFDGNAGSDGEQASEEQIGSADGAGFDENKGGQ